MENSLEVVEYIVNNLVQNPQQVSVTHVPGNGDDVIELRVADEDIGKVIGKNGSVARSIRTLLATMGARDKKNYILEIID